MKPHIVFLFFVFISPLWGQQALNFDEPEYKKRKELYPVLCAGDYSAFDVAFQNGEAGLLWFYVLASHRTPEENRSYEYAKKLLSQLPGHTQNIIDRIEQTAESTKGIYGPDGRADARLRKLADTEEELRVLEELAQKASTNVAGEFIDLQKLGSPECVQTLMTYLDDERRIGGTFGQEGYRPGSTNQWLAIGALAAVLKDEDPALEEYTHKIVGKPYNVTAMVRRFKEWWQSDASKKWRTPVVKTTRSHLLPGASQAPATPFVLPTLTEIPTREALWPILLILSLAAVAAILGFSKLKRR